MEPENNSSASSFEDLANLNENEMKEMESQGKSSKPSTDNTFMDILGNGQLTKKIIVNGQDEHRPTRGDLCKIAFTGRIEEQSEAVENVPETEIHLGDNEVCQGLDMAIALMNLGEKAEVTVNSRFAYGELGLSDDNNAVIVPKDSTMVYTIELLQFGAEDEDTPKAYEVRKAVGTRKRERGNFWFKRDEFNMAIQLYRKALEYLDENIDSYQVAPPTMTNEQLHDLLELRMIVYNNLAAAQTKINATEAALKSIETVLQCQPNNVKALYRKGKILDLQGQTEEAISIFQKAATLDPDNKSFQNELSKLILKRSREQRNEKNLYQKMLGQAQKMEQRPAARLATTPTPTESKWKPWTYLLGAILFGVAGVAFYRYKY